MGDTCTKSLDTILENNKLTRYATTVHISPIIY